MIRNCLWLIGLLAVPGLTHALGLGKLELNSALNEPFDARIELLSATVEELDSLKIILADNDAFASANIERPLVLSQLKFEVKEVDAGKDYIHVFTGKPIREPFLNFLLEISWSQGRLFREYTVLLDPPLYDPNARPQRNTADNLKDTITVQEESEYPEPDNISKQGDHVVVYDLDYKPQAYGNAVTSLSPTVTGTQYGPTQVGDTLWSIASGLRPDKSVSVQQVMLAVFQANQDAFINNNINGLKKGAILDLPDLQSMQSVSFTEAMEMVKTQQNLWNRLQGQSTESLPVQPDSSAQLKNTVDSVEARADYENPELRLLSAEQVGEGIDSISERDVTSDSASAAFALNDEAIAALEMENQDLQSRLEESESIIVDLKRLIELKEDELAAIQNQMAEAQQIQEELSASSEQSLNGTGILEQTDGVDTQPEPEDTRAEMDVETLDAEQVQLELRQQQATETPEPKTEQQGSHSQPPNVTQADENTGIIGIAQEYIGRLQALVMTHLILVGGVLGAILLVVLGLLGYRKMRSNQAETIDLPEMDVPEFDEDEGEITHNALDAFADEQNFDANVGSASAASEDATVIRDSEDTDDAFEPELSADFSLDIAPASEQEAEDPLAEVNVFLAYEHFDQAEEFVKNAIENEPDNLDYHNKLLEVYYASGNKDAYEQAAQVVHDKSGGSGEHWNMAVAMWSEMSPNRALFEAREPGMEETITESKSTKDGMIDIFSSEEDEKSDENVDIGSDDSLETLEMTTAVGSEEMMDETIDIDSMDVTGDDVLDVTSPTSIEQTMSELSNVEHSDLDDDLLDITGGVDEVDLLDSSSAISHAFDTASSEAEVELRNESEVVPPSEAVSEDLETDMDLDLALDESSDLLDISSDIDIENADASGDLLDVTAASSVEDTLEFSDSIEEPEDSLDDISTSMDLELDGLDLDLPDDNSSPSEQVPELSETASEDSVEHVMESSLNETVNDDMLAMELDEEQESDTALELDLTATSGGISEDFSLDVDVPDKGAEFKEADLDLSLDDASEESSADNGLEIDLADMTDMDVVSNTRDETQELDLEIGLSETTDDIEHEKHAEQTMELTQPLQTGNIDLDNELDMDLELDDAGMADFDFDATNTESLSSEQSLTDDLSLDIIDDEAKGSLEMEGTIELPPGSIPGVSLGDEKSENDKTLFVPKSSGSEEQSLKDEVSTKLDLAKAYVELGDQESAKSILNEIMQEGNGDQKQQAQDLLSQVDQ